MRVVHVSHVWERGGSGLYATALAEEQARRGCTVARFGPGEPRRGLHLGDAAVEARFAAACHEADVVHFHHLSGFSLALPTMAREAGCRVVFTLHDPWLLCARGQLVDRTGARCPGPEEKRCARCIADALWGPLPFAHLLPPRVGPVRERARLARLALEAVHLLLSPSRHLQARFPTSEHLSLPLLRPISPVDPGKGALRFLFLGALIPTKGADLAIEGFAMLPAGSATLTLAGPLLPWNGSEGWGRALLARAAALPGVTVAGEESPEGVGDRLSAADVLLFPSTWEENSPFVLREAAAAGLRIVAHAGPATDELAPGARRVAAPDPRSWRDAMVEEVRAGRGRLPAPTWPTLAEHTDTLMHRIAALR